MSRKIVSACLAGIQCRYDQKHQKADDILELVRCGEALPVCPEQMGGLSTPRPPAEIVGGDGEDVLDGTAKVIDIHGNDVTKAFVQGAYETLKIAKEIGATEAILKERSPSCGSCTIYNGEFKGIKKAGVGVTAALLRRHQIQVRSEEALFDQNRNK
ncbi:DUF523 domain-containing protein [Hazenella coriacea]|uniref:Uncharacterized protein YbbK (DUF523 family) n=1 Tax=Hazenella coriacea TaxID=1179467 RepID=A0A4R3LB93_9BACL|nr:DUF523 domain-containing protein [Hazenella coriacea]TCS94786.1 uncharacterized protein YbbK (DUF523 family) [Hazenella coriacea]